MCQSEKQTEAPLGCRNCYNSAILPAATAPATCWSYYRKREAVSDEEPPSKTKKCTVSRDGRTILGSHTHGVAAMLVNDDPIGKRFIMSLDVQSALPGIQRVLLDKVNIINSCDLYKRNKERDSLIAPNCNRSCEHNSSWFWGRFSYLFQQSRRVYIQFAAPLYDMNGAIFTPEFIHSVTVHKHRNQWTCRKPPFIGLGYIFKKGNLSLIFSLE